MPQDDEPKTLSDLGKLADIQRRFEEWLNSPIEGPWIDGSDQSVRDAEDHVAGEQARKLHCLLIHRRFDPESPDCWKRLAIWLALHHHPGFRVHGVPPGWEDRLEAVLAGPHGAH